jgi:hypothetical protein
MVSLYGRSQQRFTEDVVVCIRSHHAAETWVLAGSCGPGTSGLIGTYWEGSNMWQVIVSLRFVINLGIAFCAGIYPARVLVPQQGDIPSQKCLNTGLIFRVYMNTVPLTLLTIASICAE